MRWICKGAINEEEEQTLLQVGARKILLKKAENPIILKILDIIGEHFDFEISDNSYCRIEKRSQGHPWHCDTGSNNHMLWCKIGATMLISGDHTGGELSYKKEDGEVETIKNRQLYDLYFHTSDVEHKTEDSIGDRTVFLLFI